MIIEFWKTNENPITCYNSRGNDPSQSSGPRQIKVEKTKAQLNKKAVTVEAPDGLVKQFESVIEAADYVGMNQHTLYAYLNGRAKNSTQYNIYKSQINN